MLHIYDNEPPSSFHSDNIKAINERHCLGRGHDYVGGLAGTLCKWAVFELFALQELVGQNFLGRGHDYAGGLAGTHVKMKKTTG